MFSTDEIKKASEIFYYLLEHKELSSKEELYQHCRIPNVREILDILGTSANSRIVLIDNVLYLTLILTMSFRYKRAELKERYLIEVI